MLHVLDWPIIYKFYPLHTLEDNSQKLIRWGYTPEQISRMKIFREAVEFFELKLYQRVRAILIVSLVPFVPIRKHSVST